MAAVEAIDGNNQQSSGVNPWQAYFDSIKTKETERVKGNNSDGQANATMAYGNIWDQYHAAQAQGLA